MAEQWSVLYTIFKTNIEAVNLGNHTMLPHLFYIKKQSRPFLCVCVCVCVRAREELNSEGWDSGVLLNLFFS
jgi:hypothetical protein